jgi:tetratricopeptide (TPR) repeat protein
LTLARFGRWEDVLAIAQPPNTNDFLVDRALWHFTRGLAFAAQKNVVAAEREQQALSTITASDEVKKLSSHAFPVADTLAVSEHWLAGKVAGAKGDKDKMVEQLEKAVAAQDAIPYMEPSYWPIPVRPALGAALIEAGNATRAEQVFREDLKDRPRNGWGLFGLEQSLRAQGKTQQADDVKRQLAAAWSNADVKLELAWF